jgi:beta-glucanase (GH16 family)
MSAFEVARRDTLSPPEPAFWDRQDSTFFCNEAHFTPENVRPAEGGGVSLVLQAEAKGDRRYTAADLVTKADPAAQYRYGRFEVVMKPAKVSGTISAFFLYRFDPWQEIDTEFLGRDTTKIMLNVYYNPGEEGDLYNYGFAGTPVLVDLGFDAADDFHTYAVEWDADEIRWFVDDRLLHRRPAGRPTPIPHLPMRLHLNFWPTCSEALAGPLEVDKLPATATFRSVTISDRVPDPLARVWAWYDDLWQPEPAPRWQDQAAWIHDRRSVVPPRP